jgi:hypothetical protein
MRGDAPRREAVTREPAQVPLSSSTRCTENGRIPRQWAKAAGSPDKLEAYGHGLNLIARAAIVRYSEW